jgi:hypothetical protein
MPLIDVKIGVWCAPNLFLCECEAVVERRTRVHSCLNGKDMLALSLKKERRKI